MGKKSFYISIVAVTLFFWGLIFLPLANANDDEIFSNHNIRAVQNLKTTTFKLTRPMFITSIETYHWNDQKGKPPGKIGIRGVGLWQAKGSPGMHNTPNAYWTAHPNIRLEPGIYAITDSDPATWSQNSESGGLGFVKVFGKPIASNGASTSSIPVQKPKNGKIRIVSATYGGNCGAPPGNVTRHIANQCDGKTDCKYTVDYKVIGDPSSGCKKTYVVRYQCGNSNQIYEKSLSAEAGWGDKTIELDCR